MIRIGSSFLGVLLVVGAFGACSSEPEPLQEGVFIQNATLIDGTGGAPQEGANIWIRDNRIEAIGSDLEAPRGATVVDATGKYVVPGLIDTHIHLDAVIAYQISPEEREQIIEHNGTSLLYNGVTTVLNLSSNEEWIWARREAQRQGRIVSPRIYAMGSSFTPAGGWGSQHGGAIKDADHGRQRVADYLALDTDGFKVIIEDGLGDKAGKVPVISQEVLEAVAEAAAADGVPVYLHAINLEEYRKAVSIRPRAIVHGLEERVPEGDPLFQDMVDNNVAVIPTASLFEAFLHYDERPGGFDDPVLKGTVPTFLLERMRSPEFMEEEHARFQAIAGDAIYEWVAEKIPIFRENVTRMHEAGVKQGIGTDAGGRVGWNFQGYNTPWEMKIFVECGFTAMETLEAATRVGAEIIGVEDELGTVEAGKLADLLILDANPLDDIENIRAIHLIVRDGHVHPRADFAYKAS